MRGDLLEDDLPDAIRVVLGEARDALPEFLIRDLETQLDRGLLTRSDYVTLRELLPRRWRRLLDRMVTDGDDDVAC